MGSSGHTRRRSRRIAPPFHESFLALTTLPPGFDDQDVDRQTSAMYHLYREEGLSLYRVGLIFGISGQGVKYRFGIYGLPTRRHYSDPLRDVALWNDPPVPEEGDG
jgi:hypothetical protein